MGVEVLDWLGGGSGDFEGLDMIRRLGRVGKVGKVG